MYYFLYKIVSVQCRLASNEGSSVKPRHCVCVDVWMHNWGQSGDALSPEVANLLNSLVWMASWSQTSAQQSNLFVIQYQHHSSNTRVAALHSDVKMSSPPHRVDLSSEKVQSVCVCNTRELVTQTLSVVVRMASLTAITSGSTADDLKKGCIMEKQVRG